MLCSAKSFKTRKIQYSAYGCTCSGIVSVLSVFLTHIDVRVEELGPGVAGQHVDDDDLPPLLHIDQEVTQLPVILVDQVDAFWANLLKRHNNAACHQLRHIFIYTTGGVVRVMFLEPEVWKSWGTECNLVLCTCAALLDFQTWICIC